MTAVRVPDVLLRVSPLMIERYQSLAVLGAGRGRAAPHPYNFSRADASTCATYIDRDGIVRLAAANKLRIEWVDLDGDGIRETPGFAFEGSRQNLLLQSEAFNVTWSLSDATISSNADTAPDGTATADRLVEGVGVGVEHVAFQQVTGTADVKHSLSVFVKAGTRTWVVLGIRDVNGATNSVHAYFNLATGAIGTVGHLGAGSGEQAFIEKLGNGWYRCRLIGACNVGDTTPVLTVGAASADNTRIYNGDGASYISIWGAQFENNTPIPSSYIKTAASAVTRAADAFTMPINAGPSDVTILARFARPIWADLAIDIGFFPGIFSMGNGVEPHLQAYRLQTAAQYQAAVSTPGADSFSPAANIPAGASQILVAQFKNLTSAGQTAHDSGSGYGAFGSAAAAFSGFGAQTLRVGSRLAGSEFYGVLTDLIVARGLFTLAEMAAIP